MVNFKKKPVVSIVTNMPVHHQVELFDAIHESGLISLTVYYLRKMSAGRLWDVPTINHPHVFLPEIRIKDHWYINRGVLNLLNALKESDIVIIGQYASLTMQLCMYYLSFSHKRWIFWSEAISGIKYSESPLINSEWARSMARHFAIIPIVHWSSTCWGIGATAIESYKQMLPNAHFANFPYYSDLKPFFKLHEDVEQKSSFTFLFSGSLIYRKGFDILIDAVTKLIEYGHDKFSIRVLGEGPLKEKIPIQLYPYFTMVGFVQRRDLAAYYSNADVFLFPSRYDGWGMSLVEALAAGLPVIASPYSGAAREMIKSSMNGWLLESLDAETLAQKMAWCLLHRQKLKKMSDTARYSAFDYHIDVGVKRFVSLINERVFT